MSVSGVVVGDRCERTVTIDLDSIKTFATTYGDENPLHHDEAYAKKTRFGSIIACGPHYQSLLFSLAATHFSRRTSMVGMEFTIRFLAAVKAGTTVRLAWQVTEVVAKPSLNGDIVTAEGEVVDTSNGTVAMRATGKMLVMPAPTFKEI